MQNTITRGIGRHALLLAIPPPEHTRSRPAQSLRIAVCRLMGTDSGEVLKSASRDADDQHILWDFDPNVFQ